MGSEEFAINRMTARRALAELEKDGLLRILHGNGTFVADAPIPYAIGTRVRFPTVSPH
ncbi:GntR family transcriptional regulator [Rhizobium sp. HT1-10]|uniref:GntR family transcriptional regulator n=1 Tax=Rhizobium sp. HT1-10 TaxID=3111638 RepID=UPI003C2B89ED